MAKPLTPAQAAQNRAFLKLLARTRNVRLACRELGLKYGTMQHRRRVQPGFAVRWEAALVAAEAALAGAGGDPSTSYAGPPPRSGEELDPSPQPSPTRGAGVDRPETRSGRVAPSVKRPVCSPLRPGRYKTRNAGPSTIHSSVNGSPPHAFGAGRNGEGLFRTAGGEMTIVRLRSGKLQMRRAQPGKLTREAEQAYLAALAATCNKSLAAAAVGAAFNAFNRRRHKDPAFAREERFAVQQGWERLEMALLESGVAGSHEHGDWRRNEPPAMPPMSVSQALQLMYLHQKAALLIDEPTPMRRRKGESNAACNERLALMSEARDQRAREEFEIAEAERWAKGEPAWGPAGEDVREKLMREGRGPSTSCAGPPPLEIEGRIWLPDLAQVTGWSRADPSKVPHDPERALFGGWRIEEMEARLHAPLTRCFAPPSPARGEGLFHPFDLFEF